MNNEEKCKLINERLDEQDLFKCLSVDNVNHKPHPYMIGPSHVAFASDNYGGMLRDSTIKEGERVGKCRCYWKGKNGNTGQRCNLPYDQHTSDNVAFLQLNRNGTNDEANTILKSLVDTIGEKFVDGFAFVETEENYRIS